MYLFDAQHFTETFYISTLMYFFILHICVNHNNKYKVFTAEKEACF